MLVDELYERLETRLSNYTVEDVRIGLGYTAVRLSGGRCGLAYTFRDEAREGCAVIREAGSLAGRAASEAAAWVRSFDAIGAAVGLAALNALVTPPPDASATGLLELLDPRADDTVGMVGYFGPLVGPLRARVRELRIFERQRRDEPDLYPDWAAHSLLADCHVVIVSAATLLNRTMDALLELAAGAREVAILGPSTPMLPDLFAKRRVTFLSGVEVIDPERALRIVSEGGGTRQLGPAVRKLSVRMPRPSRQG